MENYIYNHIREREGRERGREGGREGGREREHFVLLYRHNETQLKPLKFKMQVFLYFLNESLQLSNTITIIILIVQCKFFLKTVA